MLNFAIPKLENNEEKIRYQVCLFLPTHGLAEIFILYLFRRYDYIYLQSLHNMGLILRESMNIHDLPSFHHETEV